MNAQTKKKVQARLKRIAGQVEGIRRMVEEDRYCVDVLLQLAAAKAALEGVGQVVLSSHVDTCVSTALDSSNRREARKKMNELLEVFDRFGAIRPR